MTDKQVLDFVAEGTYQRTTVSVDTATFVAGTEYEVANVANLILASTANQDEMYTWIRGMMFVYDTATAMCYEWFVIRCEITDATQDLDDSTVAEALHKDKKIYARGLIMAPDPDMGGPVKPIKFEFHKVRLRYGEELRLLLRPILVSGGATGYVKGVLEWRQVD